MKASKQFKQARKKGKRETEPLQSVKEMNETDFTLFRVRTFYSRVDALRLSSFVIAFELIAGAEIKEIISTYNCQTL